MFVEAVERLKFDSRYRRLVGGRLEAVVECRSAGTDGL